MELLTPRGRGGVAVVRALGDECERLRGLLRRPLEQGSAIRAGTGPARAVLRLSDEIVDDVLVVDRADAGLEVHLHGSPAILDLLVRVVGPLVVPLVTPARALLLRATSRAQVELALEQEAIDFDAYCVRVGGSSAPWAAQDLAAALVRSRAAKALAEPLRLVLCGRQNAGKSTLFNRLLFRERALAGPLAGLTRDAVVEATDLGGYPVEVVDTAGEGEVGTAVDAEALRRSRFERDRADVKLLVVDRHRGVGEVERAVLDERTLVVATKGDLQPAAWPEDFPCHARVACAEPATAPVVRERVADALRVFRGLPPAGPVGGVAALDAAQWSRLVELASAHGIAPA